ncbi:Uncharacterized protein APZ42_017708 [Daphnia magna]|uniref:Uncharacterized protein n=1 Tax=Daphnia magna TaxID=35525 RepID=A0A164ZN39_9CRUS|nr:Uncharacterized protein APZ42_017708 [Daphnia magna]
MHVHVSSAFFTFLSGGFHYICDSHKQIYLAAPSFLELDFLKGLDLGRLAKLFRSESDLERK